MSTKKVSEYLVHHDDTGEGTYLYFNEAAPAFPGSTHTAIIKPWLSTALLRVPCDHAIRG
jgi:hypothetical protein